GEEGGVGRRDETAWRAEPFELRADLRGAALPRGQVLEREPREDRLLRIARFLTGAREPVALLDEEPLLAGRLALRLHPDERPAAAQLVSEQVEQDLALALGLLGVADDRPPAPVPDDRLARAVVAVRDHALEVGVLDGVVLDLHGEALLGGVGRGALRHRPGLEHTSPLEPQASVHPPGPP